MIKQTKQVQPVAHKNLFTLAGLMLCKNLFTLAGLMLCKKYKY